MSDYSNTLPSAFGNPSVQTMSSREIAELCEKEHKHVIRDIRVMLAALGDGPDLGHVQEIKDSRGYTSEFFLDRDLTMTLVSGYDANLRHRIIKRLAELEHMAKSAMLALPQDFASALRALADSSEKVQALEAANAELAPKAEALDMISAQEGSLTFRQAAKMLGIKQDAMTKWMHANRWVYRENGSWVAYKQHIMNGRLEYKEHTYTSQTTGMQSTKQYCHFTHKGLTKLAEAMGLEAKGAA